MITVKLNDELFKELHILRKSEYEKIGSDYRSTAIFDKKIKTAFLPGYGTTLFFENKHFIIVNDNKPLKKYTIWRNHKVIGYCDITKEAAEKANEASNAEFYFGFDKITAPENIIRQSSGPRECKPPGCLLYPIPQGKGEKVKIVEIKKTKNNVNIYDGGKLILHLDKCGDIYTAVSDSIRISAKLEKISENSVKVSDVLLKKINSRGKMVKNTSIKWTRHYTTWLQSVCTEYGLF